MAEKADYREVFLPVMTILVSSSGQFVDSDNYGYLWSYNEIIVKKIGRISENNR